MVEGPRRSLCSDNRAPDGKKTRRRKIEYVFVFRLLAFFILDQEPDYHYTKRFCSPPLYKAKNEYVFVFRLLAFFILEPDYHYTKIFCSPPLYKAKNEYVFVFRLLVFFILETDYHYTKIFSPPGTRLSLH